MPHKMTDSELVAILSAAEEDAAIFNGEFMSENEKFLNGYLANPTGDFGNFQADQSSVVSTDIADVVEADMPSLVRIFLGSGDVIKFEPNTENEVEIQEAEEKTKYVNWVIRNQPDSFTLIHNWLKDAEIQKNSVVKYFIDESKEVEEVSYTGVDQVELGAIIESLKDPKISKIDKVITKENKVDVLSREINEEAKTFDIKFRVTRTDKKTVIINVPPESFLISKTASSIEDAELVGDRIRKTRGQLLAEGFPRDLVTQLSTVDLEDRRSSTIKNIRDRDQGGVDGDADIANWASENVEISDLYVRVDFDGDGIAERRHVMMSGNKILVNESFNHRPYASLSAILMPHKAIGRSRAEITYETQRQKTSLIRGVHNNIHMVNNPRNVVHDDVDLDDMLTVRVNGIVRMDDESNVLPRDAVFPLVTPYIGDKTLQVIQYTDQARAQTTGSLLASQGLEADQVNDETATRFDGVKEKGDEKVELLVRNYAETGFRKLYEGIAWLASRFQDTETEFRVLGKALTVNPKSWKYDHHVSTVVGLGAGDNKKLVQSLQGILAMQTQFIGQGSTLADEVKVYNTAKRIIDGLGLPRVDEFFNNPEVPDDNLKAENEVLNKVVEQLEGQLAAVENPLKEAEEIKQQAFLIKAQADAQIKVAELEERIRQFDIEMSQKRKESDEAIAAKLTELELKFKENVPGAVV